MAVKMNVQLVTMMTAICQMKRISEELDGNTPIVCVTQPPEVLDPQLPILKEPAGVDLKKATHRLHHLWI